MRSLLALAVILATAAGAKEPARAHGFTLVIVGAQQNTTMNYPTEAACMRAVAAIRAQTQSARPIPGGGVIYSSPPQVFCIPR